MYISHLLSAVFAVSALAAEVSEVWADGTSFGEMLARGEALAKRQGYTPTQQTCGRGQTCQDACGASYVQCPSTDSRIHCHNPLTGTHCCTDGTGNACKANYYCTTDGRGKTYCCPDGIQNAECARLYSLTISLFRPSSIPALPSISGPPVLASTSLIHVTSTPKSVATASPSNNVPVPSVKPSGRNSTSIAAPPSGATRTTTQVPLFTGGAAKVAGVGLAVLVEAVGLLV